jgi:predicted ATPase
MTTIFGTGMSGVGKSAALAELTRRGEADTTEVVERLGALSGR